MPGKSGKVLNLNATQAFPFFRDHQVLFQPHTRRLSLLNSTAGLIWTAYQAGDSVRRIADNLAATSDMDPARLRADVEQCLVNWREQGLLNTEKTANTTARPTTQVRSPPEKTQYSPTSWRYQLTLQVCTRSIRLRMSSRKLHTALQPILAHLTTTPAASRGHTLDIWRSPQGNTVIAVDAQPGVIVRSPANVIAQILYFVVELAYRRDDDLAILHASAVAVKGGALLLAGAGGSGKTTLAAMLQVRGFIYLCDDVCPVTRCQQMRPVAMSQAIKAGSWPILKTLRPEIQAAPVYQRYSQRVRFLPPITGTLEGWNRTWPLKGLLFPRYRPESSRKWRALDPLESLQLLLQTQSIYSEHITELLHLIEHTPAFELQYGDFEQAYSGIQQIVDTMRT